MIQLQAGERRKLADLLLGSPLQVRLSASMGKADASAFGLNERGILNDDRYFVFYNQLESPQGSIRLQPNSTGGTFQLQLSGQPCSRIAFIVSADTGQLNGLQTVRISLLDATGVEKAFFLVNVAQSSDEAVMLAELYQQGGEWFISTTTQYFASGLQGALDTFQREQPQASQPSPSTAAHGLGTTLTDFLQRSAEKDHPGDVFELESSKMLEVKVNGRVWSKLGAMVAYKGQLTFKRASTLSDVMQGYRSGGASGVLNSLMNAAVKAASGELEPLASIEGQGVCYLADQGKEITILKLQGDAINVNGNDLLAFEDSVNHKITMHRSMAGMVSGGLFSVRMQGHGLVAILSHGKPLTLKVTPHEPIYTDPNATVAWSEHLHPEITMDHSLRSFIGRGGGETLQMVFRGSGFVVVQPYEERPEIISDN